MFARREIGTGLKDADCEENKGNEGHEDARGNCGMRGRLMCIVVGEDGGRIVGQAVIVANAKKWWK